MTTCFIPSPDLQNGSQPVLLNQLQLTMPWYKGWRREIGSSRSILGGTLAEAIDTIGMNLAKERPFFATVCATAGIPLKAIAWVHSGPLKLGAKLTLFPHNKHATVKNIRSMPPFDRELMDPESDWLEGRLGNLVELSFE
jgi:translation elongation factor EF-1alpha